jgi:hypothetical protein
MLSNRKPTPEKIREDLLRTEREMERMSKLDPDCNAAKRRAAFFERCKTTDTKLQPHAPEAYAAQNSNTPLEPKHKNTKKLA